MPKALLIYPRFADALWGHKSALEFVGKKASSPPLGLLTVAAMLPADWAKQFVDLNTTDLLDQDIRTSDYVFLSAMLAQQASTEEVIARIKNFGVPIIAGGPLFSVEYAQANGFDQPDRVVIGEAESVLPQLLEDIEQGNTKKIYQSTDRPSPNQIPTPLWSLVNLNHYAMMNLQITRGCPYLCEFCAVTVLNGHQPRTKSQTQIVAELDALYERDWRGAIFVCDDNLIGNRLIAKTIVLPTMIAWMQKHDHPFSFTAAVSVDLANEDEILQLMVQAGFERVTLGIETPHRPSLEETRKFQNQAISLPGAIKKIQNNGLEVQGGFIVGFDNDPPTIFDLQSDFIQRSGIVTAMVSLLFAFPGTPLYTRLKEEKRLSSFKLGARVYGIINFTPRMELESLLAGYKRILTTLYAPANYYRRIQIFLKEYVPPMSRRVKIEPDHLKIFFKIIWRLGIADRDRKFYWALFFTTLFKNVKQLPLVIRLAVTGYFTRQDIQAHLL